MKKIYLKGEEPRKQLYRIILKEISKQIREQALVDLDNLVKDVDRMNRDLMQNKDNKK